MSASETDPLPEVVSRRALAAAEVVGGRDLLADPKRPLHVACLGMAARHMRHLPQVLSVTVYT